MVDLTRMTRWMSIPAELRERRQWAVSTLTLGPDGRKDKRPRRADGSEMDWHNPLQWMTFDEAASAGFPAIGFILTPGDPFTIIDLDYDDKITEADQQRQQAVFAAFPSYTERSQSGQGLHIVLLGRIGGGVRRDYIEVYDQERYMICTGDEVTPGPIQSHPDLLARMVDEMGGVRATAELPPSEDEPCGDDELIERMSSARNGDKFKQLFYGPVNMGSENDAALFSLLVFWTKNHDQIMRLFARSVLYRPRGEADGKKGHSARSYHEKYLVETLATAYAAQSRWNAADPADVEHGRALAAQLLAPSAPEDIPLVKLDFPSGLVGEVAQYLYDSAPRQLPEVAMAGALAFMAGICGRQYTVSSGVGLNLYVILLAESGMGKEGAKNGADRLFHAMTAEAPGTGVFLGPRVVSGPALEKAVSEHNPCFVTFVGEVGVRLQQMLAPRGGDPQMKAAWLGLYTAAVRGGRHMGAFHSKKEDRTQDVIFPAVTIYGESTPAEYYKAISGSNFDDGFVPRFLTIASPDTEIKRLNPNRGVPPSRSLVERVVGLAQYCVDLQVRDQYIEVRFDPGLSPEDVDAYYMKLASELPTGPVRTSWTRAPMQMFKVAALLAVGRNQLNPSISRSDLDWASRLVERSIGEIAHREGRGDLGSDEVKKVPAVEEIAKRYFTLTEKQKEARKVPKYMHAHPHLIPYRYFFQCLRDRSAFANHPRGLEHAITVAMRSAVDLGIIQRLTDQQVRELFGRNVSGGVYCLAD